MSQQFGTHKGRQKPSNPKDGTRGANPKKSPSKPNMGKRAPGDKC